MLDHSREWLSQPQLSIISAEPDPDLDAIAAAIHHSVRVADRVELESLLGGLLDATSHVPAAPKTLDLIGHSTSDGHLQLGTWTLDIAHPTLPAFLQELAQHDVLARLGIRAIRLLGCNTSGTERGRETMYGLAERLGVEVYGTPYLLYHAHYDAAGFRADFLLTPASALRSAASPIAELTPWPRLFDLDALPAEPLTELSAPAVVASPIASARILRLIRRTAGGQLAQRARLGPGLALPSPQPGRYCLAHMLYDGEFLQFYPDGPRAPGVVYPVDDAPLLRSLVGELLAS